jgi:hypothetical protein
VNKTTSEQARIGRFSSSSSSSLRRRHADRAVPLTNPLTDGGPAAKRQHHFESDCKLLPPLFVNPVIAVEEKYPNSRFRSGGAPDTRRLTS